MMKFFQLTEAATIIAAVIVAMSATIGGLFWLLCKGIKTLMEL